MSDPFTPEPAAPVPDPARAPGSVPPAYVTTVPAGAVPPIPAPAERVPMEGTLDPQRIEQFRAEIDQMHVKGANGSAERWLLVLGVVLVVVGVVLALLGAVQVVNAGDSPPNQRAAMASGCLLGIVFVIAGAAVFVRYSFGRFMRFWLVRLVYEGHSDTDRIVDAIDRAAGPELPGPGGGPR